MAKNKERISYFNFFEFVGARQTFLIALLLACLFWLSTKLSKPSQYSIPVKIDYILPQGKTFKKAVPDNLTVTFEGVGWSLFNLKSKAKQRKVNVAIQDIETQVFGTEKLAESIANTFGRGKLTVSNIIPSQILMELEAKINKRIPVRLEKTFSIAPGFAAMSDFVIEPDSISVSGPISKVSEIYHWPTINIQLNDLKESYDSNIQLAPKPDSTIEISHSEVNMRIDVERATEKTITVPIFVPESFQNRIRLIPGKVEVICQTGLSNYDNIVSDDFRIELPYYAPDKLEQEPNIDLKITRKPERVSHIRLRPNTVEVFISKDDN